MGTGHVGKTNRVIRGPLEALSHLLSAQPPHLWGKGDWVQSYGQWVHQSHICNEIPVNTEHWSSAEHPGCWAYWRVLGGWCDLIPHREGTEPLAVCFFTDWSWFVSCRINCNNKYSSFLSSVSLVNCWTWRRSQEHLWICSQMVRSASSLRTPKPAAGKGHESSLFGDCAPHLWSGY